MLLQASIIHLSAIGSDHKPLLLDLNLITVSCPKPFRFEGMWLRDSSIGHIVCSAWNKRPYTSTMAQIMSQIKYTKLALKGWNRNHFGYVQTQIRELKQVIATLQSLPQSNCVLDTESAVYRNLDEILAREHILWK